MIGKGGVGLVVYHLAKRRIEFAITSDHCPSGDIWIEVAGKKSGIEVKTCRKGRAWHVNRRQVGAAEFYCLVSFETAACFVVTGQEMAVAAADAPNAYRGIALVSDHHLPAASFNAWEKLTGRPEKTPRQPIRYTSTRRVTRRMKDGSTKVYEYPPTPDMIALTADRTFVRTNLQTEKPSTKTGA